MRVEDDIWGVGVYMDDTSDKDIFPESFHLFIDKVRPRIAKVQDVEDALVLIHLKERTSFLCRGEGGELVFDECRGSIRERSIVEEGLMPLVDLLVITREEATSIKDWFLWVLDPIKDEKPFSKHIEVGGMKYLLRTEKDGRKRRLCLRTFHIPLRI
jgi:hypothetical protein